MEKDIRELEEVWIGFGSSRSKNVFQKTLNLKKKSLISAKISHRSKVYL